MTDALTLPLDLPQAKKPATLVLIDGHAMAYRAYFALLKRGFKRRDGMPTGAVYGFVRMLLEVIGRVKPEMVVVSFDHAAPTFRHDQFEDYKAHRKPMPDDLRPQMALIRDVVRAFDLPIHEIAGYEADDVIGTLSRQAADLGHKVLIVTGDQDSLQLVDERVRVLFPKSGATDLEPMDTAAVHAKYGLLPSQIADYKALRGDPSDNIPGVPGIGEKTATKLLQDFGTLEALLADLEKVENAKLRDKLAEHRELALKCQYLATIDRAVPLEGVDWDAMRLSVPDLKQLTQVLADLEFRTVIDQLPTILGDFLGEAAAKLPSAPEPVAVVADALQLVPDRPLDVRSRIVTTREDLADLVGQISAVATTPGALLAFDVETSGLDALRDQLVGVALAFGHPAEDAAESEVPPGLTATTCEAVYVPVGHEGAEQLPLAEVLAALKPVLEDPRTPKVAHNAKFDVNVLAQHGVTVRGLALDTLLADHMVNSSTGHGLKELGWTYLRYRMTPISDLIGTGAKAISMAKVPVEKAATYAAADAAVTLELAAFLTPRVAEPKLNSLLHDVEMPLVDVLARMEQHGIRVDVAHLQALSSSMGDRIAQLEREIQESCGCEFNVNSPKQLATVLFEKLGLPVVKKTKTGPSTDASVLEELSDAHACIPMLLEYRQITKLKSTYVDALPTMLNPRTGFVHTCYTQIGAATGRLSSNDPNLQNIPIRTELGRQIRRAFLPTQEGNWLLSADYSQIELRVLAHIAQEPAFLRAFREGIDIHAMTASEVFGVPLDQVTPEHRRKAKAVNFGIVYGQSGFGLANSLGIPQKEAREIIARFKERYAGLAQYNLETVLRGKRDGYVSTLLGRRRHIPELASGNRQLRDFGERMAINTPIQGSAADLIKVAMVRVERALRERQLRTAMVLTVHDELIFEVPADELETAKELVKTHMENAFQLSVPLVVDLHAATNWMDAK